MGRDQRQDEIAKLEARLEALKRGEEASAPSPSRSPGGAGSSAPLLVIGGAVALSEEEPVASFLLVGEALLEGGSEPAGCRSRPDRCGEKLSVPVKVTTGVKLGF